MIWPLPPSPCPLSYVVLLCILPGLWPKQIISVAYIVSFLSADTQQRNMASPSREPDSDKSLFSVCLFVDQVWSQDQPRICFTHCLSVQAPPLTNTIRPSWLFAFLQHIGVRGDWETLSSCVLSKCICWIEYWKAAKQSPKSAFNCYNYAVQSCHKSRQKQGTLLMQITSQFLVLSVKMQ